MRVRNGFAFLLIVLTSALVAAQPAVGVKTFENSIIKLPPGAQANAVALTNEARQRSLELHFAIESGKAEELQARVARGETVPPSEMKEKYSGNEKDFKALVEWLEKQGFTITQTSSDFANVYAKGSVAQIEKSLGVKMEIVTYKNKTTPAAVTPPKLPHDIGDHVVAIDGLQPFIQAVKHTVPRQQHTDTVDNKKESAKPKSAAVSKTLRPEDILKAYNADGLGTGSGQEIAILIDTVPNTNDLKTFWKKIGVAEVAGRVRFIDVQGPTAPLPAPDGEETLDTEWASGMAPGAKISVYASGSLVYAFLDRALDRIYADAQTNPELRQVSISLGLREDLLSQDEIRAENAIFLKLAAIGVTVFVSSGDAGSNPDETGHAHGQTPGVEYEASDPYTVAVGGTTLRFDRVHAQVTAETAWPGSGGGVSGSFPRPAWQRPYSSIAVPNRLVPDVSSVADPSPGAFVWLRGKEWPVGGTSWSTPTWAALCALIGEARQKQGKSAVFLSPVLYKLPPDHGFRDVKNGTNGAYSAGVGWDPVTGLGVPDVKALLAALP